MRRKEHFFDGCFNRAKFLTTVVSFLGNCAFPVTCDTSFVSTLTALVDNCGKNGDYEFALDVFESMHVCNDMAEPMTFGTFLGMDTR